MRVTLNLFTQLEALVTSLTKLIVTVPLQLSVAVTCAVLTAGMFDAQVTVVAAGHVSPGTTLSLTVIVCEQVAVLPHTSAAR